MKNVFIITTLLFFSNIHPMDVNTTNCQDSSSSWSLIDTCKFFALPALMAIRYGQLYFENVQLHEKQKKQNLQLHEEHKKQKATLEEVFKLRQEKAILKKSVDDLSKTTEFLRRENAYQSNVNATFNNVYKIKEANERRLTEELADSLRLLEHEQNLRKRFEELTPEEKKRWIKWEDVD